MEYSDLFKTYHPYNKLYFVQVVNEQLKEGGRDSVYRDIEEFRSLHEIYSGVLSKSIEAHDCEATLHDKIAVGFKTIATQEFYLEVLNSRFNHLADNDYFKELVSSVRAYLSESSKTLSALQRDLLLNPSQEPQIQTA